MADQRNLCWCHSLAYRRKVSGHFTSKYNAVRLINNVCDYSAAEHVSAVTFAMKNKMNLSINIAISSSLQIGLFVTPVLVIAGWIFGQPMTLFFENFETVILFASVLIVNYLIQDGVSNWLEGTLLLVCYPLLFYIHITHTNVVLS